MQSREVIRALVPFLLVLGLLVSPATATEDRRTDARTEIGPARAAHVTCDEAIRSAVGWLLANQREDGAWGSHHSPRWYEVLCDVPGSHDAFRVATTGLCVMALEDSPFSTEESRAAASRGIDAILSDYDVKRPSGFEHYSVWAFGYALRCLGQWLMAHPDDPRQEAIVTACRTLVKKLDTYQCLDGGWGYLSLDQVPTYKPSWTSMSFTTATCLVGLHRAQEAGIPVPPHVIKKAVRCVERSRTGVGSFSYGELWKRSRHAGIDGVKGGACRTPCCQYALRLFDAGVREKEESEGLENLLVRHLRFQKIGVRRPVPHEAWYSISGYFYLYGMQYAALLLEELPGDLRARYREPLQQAVLYCRQDDGSFWDYPLYSYHKPYGTAFALLTLSRTVRWGE